MRLVEDLQQLTQDLRESYDDRVAAVSEMRAAARDKLAEFAVAHREMARDTVALLQELAGTRQAMAVEQRQRLAGQRADLAVAVAEQRHTLRDYADELRRDTAALLTEFTGARRTMAAEQRQQLAGQRADLAAAVAASRGTLQEELGQAHEVWLDFATVMQRRRAGQSPPASRKPVAAGDLTGIRGLGPARQRQLMKAGIGSLAQLAHSAPVELRRKLGQAARGADVTGWIEQAQELIAA